MTWPTQKSGDATKDFGFSESWAAVNACLTHGHRQLGACGSLRHVVEVAFPHRVYTESDIRCAIQEFWVNHGRFPKRSDGTKDCPYGSTWGALDAALRTGRYGLPGGSSLARLAGGGRWPTLSDEEIVKAAQRFKRQYGRWPQKRDSEGPSGKTWSGIDQQLRGRGSSLNQLLGVAKKPPLSERLVLKAGEKYRVEHGRWPSKRDGSTLAYLGFEDTWNCVNEAFVGGLRGLTSQAKSMHEFFASVDAQGSSGKKPADVRQLMRDFKAAFGKYPSAASPDFNGHKWKTLNMRLSAGYAGVPGGSSLAKLKAELEAEGEK